MDEFAALAQRVVLTMDDVRGCLVLSRDGLVLGAFPEDQEAELKPAWLRFVHVGEARKGFVEFSDQLWAFVHRGPYAAFVVTGTSVRPGVMLDQLEQAVIAAEETRAKQKEVTLKVPDAASAPSGRPRTSLHPPADRPAPAPAPVGQTAASAEMPSFAAPSGLPDEGGSEPEWQGADPAHLQQMQAMQEQMAAMQAQLQQQALQQAPQQAPPSAPPQVQRPAPSPAPAGSQQLSGYRRPETATPAPVADPPVSAPAPGPAADLTGRARPSVEGSPYEAVLDDERSASPFGAESSPFARLEAEQTAAAAEPAPSDDGAFREEPQRLISPEEPAPPPEEDPGEVDRVMLAKEFSGLLQVGEDGDED
ncbi:MAG: hypothetical protein ABJB55_10630 [Actinomycetota bacterium]